MSNTALLLNPLITAYPPDEMQTSLTTALEFARLLNQARILLRERARAYDDVGDFEQRCRKEVGPIVERINPSVLRPGEWDSLRWAIGQLLSELPARRDWLNPNVEQILRDHIGKPK